MKRLIAGDPSSTTDDRGAPSALALALRPLGYLLGGVVWTAIWAVTVCVAPGFVVYLVLDDPEAVVAHAGDFVGNPLLLLLLLPIAAAALGPAASYQLPTAAWPLAVLSFLFAARSLNPRFAGEKLSFTAWAPSGSTLGPSTLGKVSMSLQPVHRTPFTDAVMRFYISGWDMDWRMFVAMLPAGLAWPLAVYGFVDGLDATTHLVFRVVAAVLLVTSLVLAVRAFRRRFWGYPGRAPRDRTRSVADMSVKERRRRLKALRRARAKRGR